MTETTLSPTYSGLGFGQAFRSVLGKYATFSGRATRSEYWWWALAQFLISLLLGVIALIGVVWMFSGSQLDENGIDQVSTGGVILLIVAGILSALWALFVIVPSLAVSIRRFHDGGYSGWLWLLNFIPTVGNIVVLVFMLLPSQPADNQWGAAPAPAGK